MRTWSSQGEGVTLVRSYCVYLATAQRCVAYPVIFKLYPLTMCSIFSVQMLESVESNSLQDMRLALTQFKD